MRTASTTTANITRPGLRPIIAGATALIGLMAVSAGAAQAQAQVPTVDIKETCRVAAQVTVSLSGGTSQNDMDICMKGENDAREQMIKNWSSFEPSDRAGCIQPIAYLPSYIEWLTCFEMNKQVREMRQRGQVSQDVLVKGKDGAYTLPTLPYFGKGKTYY